MPIPFIAVAIVGALALGGGVAVTVSTINEANSTDEAVIDRVIDGDTVDVRMYSDVHRVRLLNINSPEDNAATGVAECMGPKATAALVELLPKGSTVTSRYHSERYDRYDRLLAGIFVDDTLINAEMAREGLASPMVVGENTRFIEEVQSAETRGKGERSRHLRHRTPVHAGVDCQVVQQTRRALRWKAPSPETLQELPRFWRLLRSHSRGQMVPTSP